TVTDSGGRTDTDTAVVTVANVAPTAAFGNNGSRPEGSPVTFTLGGPSDPSAADTAAGFTYSFDFNGDGTFDVSGSSAAASYTYTTAGTYTVAGRIADKDGGFTDYTATVTVTNPATGRTFYVATTGSDT